MRKKTQGRPRALLVSYHFGLQGITGGFRWGAMVRDLIRSGWEFDVITTSTGVHDEPGLRIHRIEVPTWPDRLSASLRGAVKALRRGGNPPSPARQNAAGGTGPSDDARREYLLAKVAELPIWRTGTPVTAGTKLRKSYDAALHMATTFHWSWRAERLGRRILEERDYSCIIVSTPPHTTQVVGARLSRRTGIPYVADFRDPWVAETPEMDGYMSPLKKVVGGRLEQYSHRASSLVIHNTPRMLERARKSQALPGVRRACVENGYDGVPSESRPDLDVFRVLFCGWLHPFMDVRVLFKAAGALVDRRSLEPSGFRLEFMGSPDAVGDLSMREIAEAYGVSAFTDLIPRAPRDEALAIQERAAVLVAFDCPHPLAVAMKFYDYQLMRGHLLLIAEPGSALDQAAGRVGSYAVSPDDPQGVLRVLEAGYERWLARDYAEPNDPDGVFHRRERSAELTELLDSL